MRIKAVILLSLVPLLAQCASSHRDKPPFELAEGVFDYNQPVTLGLERIPQAETVTIFAPEAETDRAYNHGVVMTAFKGRLYAQWQSSMRDEDAPETVISYAVSEDGKEWSSVQTLVPARENAVITNGGWWVSGDTLTAYVNVWPDAKKDQREGHVEYITGSDGLNWSDPLPVTDKGGMPIEGVIEQDLRALPSGRILTSFHVAPGLVAKPHFTDNPDGVSGWVEGQLENLPSEGPVSRELEPSWYVRSDGAIVMVFRDQSSSFKTLASLSLDGGETWSPPELIDFPDSRSKQSAGNLPDGIVFRVNNPTHDRTRYPLVISLSEDGQLFDRAFLIRGEEDLPAMRFDGRYKRIGYSYPKSFVHAGSIYVSYATNKERVEYTRIPISSIQY